jgi:hypothetical protein
MALPRAVREAGGRRDDAPHIVISAVTIQQQKNAHHEYFDLKYRFHHSFKHSNPIAKMDVNPSILLKADTLPVFQ